MDPTLVCAKRPIAMRVKQPIASPKHLVRAIPPPARSSGSRHTTRKCRRPDVLGQADSVSVLLLFGKLPGKSRDATSPGVLVGASFEICDDRIALVFQVIVDTNGRCV